MGSEFKEPWPEMPSEPCPDCGNMSELVGIASTPVRVEHFSCEDCGLDFTRETK